jgi:UDPglucose--hexose-1-phosphate uridylyltransferase
MPEFRQNLATKEWVILAPERGKRPKDISEESQKKEPLPEKEANCPFCPGNENQTEEPVFSLPSRDNWQVRVVPNKFAALDPSQLTDRTRIGMFLTAQGFGIAEVVIEHSKHNVNPALLEREELNNILLAYRQRQIEIGKNEKINLITIFRNHGLRAGTSLAHPHSQIIATPIIPPHVRYPLEQAVAYYDMYGSCVYCDMIREEISQAKRILFDGEHFAAFCPFASRSPFECRIYPKKHQASFILIEDSEILELAEIIKHVLSRLYFRLNDPDYNYFIRSAPIGDHDTRHLHWYMVIVPKITIPAGFEIGTGIYINTVSPEDAAHYLNNDSNQAAP